MLDLGGTRMGRGVKLKRTVTRGAHDLVQRKKVGYLSIAALPLPRSDSLRIYPSVFQSRHPLAAD